MKQDGYKPTIVGVWRKAHSVHYTILHLYMFEIFHTHTHTHTHTRTRTKKKSGHEKIRLSSLTTLWAGKAGPLCHPALTSVKQRAHVSGHPMTQAASWPVTGEVQQGSPVLTVSELETSLQQGRKQHCLYSMIIAKKYEQKPNTEKGIKTLHK